MVPYPCATVNKEVNGPLMPLGYIDTSADLLCSVLPKCFIITPLVLAFLGHAENQLHVFGQSWTIIWEETHMLLEEREKDQSSMTTSSWPGIPGRRCWNLISVSLSG